MGRSEVDQYHGRCCRLLGDIRLWACSFDAASGAGLFAVGGVLSLFGLHLAEFTTKGISVLPQTWDGLRLSPAGHQFFARR
jgi:hypothetical protein